MLIQFIGEKRPEGLNAATDEDVADLQVRAAQQAFTMPPGASQKQPHPTTNTTSPPLSQFLLTT
jgi:hypothetical protein